MLLQFFIVSGGFPRDLRGELVFYVWVQKKIWEGKETPYLLPLKGWRLAIFTGMRSRSADVSALTSLSASLVQTVLRAVWVAGTKKNIHQIKRKL